MVEEEVLVILDSDEEEEKEILGPRDVSFVFSGTWPSCPRIPKKIKSRVKQVEAR